MKKTSMMDAVQEQDFNEVITFNLLTDDFDLSEVENVREKVQNIADDIGILLDNVTSEEQHENYINYKVENQGFQNECFAPVSTQQIQQLQAFNEADSTHNQTEWAVKCFRGN